MKTIQRSSYWSEVASDVDISFPRRPESIFDGVEMPVAIIQVSPTSDARRFATSRISRFYSEERPHALTTVLALASHTISDSNHGHLDSQSLAMPNIETRDIFDKLCLTHLIARWLGTGSS